MTREEAINRLRDMIIEMRTYCDESKHISETDKQDMEALDMAIKALEQERNIIEEFKKIKAEFKDRILLNQTVAIQIMDKYISELKGDTE